MDTSQLTNPTVKSAFEALQNGDMNLWMFLFVEQPVFTDDGQPRDFEKFSKSAIGHERFTSLDKVANDGKDLYGQFHSDQWGDFEVFFKFQVNQNGKITRLDIGQVH